MSNMFQSAWTRHRSTSRAYTPQVQEPRQDIIVPKVTIVPRPEALEQTPENIAGMSPIDIFLREESGELLPPKVTVNPESIQETPVGPDINVATGPVEVDLGESEINAEINSKSFEIIPDVTISDLERLSQTPVVIAETRHIDIDSGEVVAQSDIVSVDGVVDIWQKNLETLSDKHYPAIIDDVNTTLQNLGNATTEDAYTYGINRLNKGKKPRPNDWIVGHIFGGTYDLWIAEYNEAERTFFGFASFGGIDDQDAEWGYVSIDELLSIKVPPVGSKLERNFYFTPCTLDSIKNKEYEQKEQAIQLGADVEEDTPRIPWQVEHENHIMLAGGPWFARDNKGVWRETTDSSTYSRTFEEGDQQDIFFDTEALRDKYFDEVNSISDDIYCPIENEIITFGDKVDKSTFNITIDGSYKQERGTIYGIRFVSDSWEDGYTHDKADAFIKSHFASNKGDSLQKIKDRYTQGGGGGPASKPGTFENYEYDSKGCTVSFKGLQYCEDVHYKYTWKEVHEILHPAEVPQASIEFPVDGSAPFNSAEEPALKTPDISWFYKPGYQKYAVAPRSNERKDRIVGNMLEEHGNNLQSLYQNFSGKGGLHEISYDDCANFNAYTEAKQEFEMGEFYTPDNIAEDMVKMLRIPASSNVIDTTCGMGRFFNFIPHEKRIYGYDKNYEALVAPRKLFENANLGSRDVFSMNLYHQYGIMQYSVGNPPFNIKQGYNWHHPLATQQDEEEGGKGILLSQDAYIFNICNYLVDGGIAFFIVPESWLNGLRHTKVRDFINEKFFIVADLKLDKKAFAEYNVEFATKALLLVKKGEGISFDMDTYTGPISDAQSFLTSPQYEQYTKMKYKADHSVAEIALKKLRNEAVERDHRFYLIDKVNKAIYETFRGKILADEKDLTEMQDPTKVKEWKDGVKNLERKKSEESILKVNIGSYHQFDELMRKQTVRLNKAISKPDRVKVTQVSFEISRYDIVVKRSNNAVTEYFNRIENQFSYNGNMIWLRNKFTKNDLCTNDAVYEEFKATVDYMLKGKFEIELKDQTRVITASVQKGLLAYVEKIRRLYTLNTMDTAKFPEAYPVEYEENVEKLSELTFKKGTIKLLPHQVEDLAGVLLKRNALISWDTGLGKTLGGITWAQMKGGTTLVIAPSVNTIDPWYQQIQEYVPDVSVMLLKNAKDIHKYKGETFLIVSFESLPKIYKQLAILHFRNLILDESDNAKNKASKRFKSLRAIAKRFKNRLLMSGTPTRNNVNEIYNQIELLAQNSNAMMCWAKEMVEYDRSTREWGTSNNPHYGEPFPAWGGHKAFENTFSPKKLTCFGAAETNQDIFNKDIFDELIRSIRFTRIFDVEKPRINSFLGIKDISGRLVEFYAEEDREEIEYELNEFGDLVPVTKYIKKGDVVKTEFVIDEKTEYKEYKQVMVPMNATENKVYNYIMTDLAQQMEEYYRALHDGATASMLVIMQQIMKLMQGTSHPWTFEGYYDDENVYHEVYDLDYNTSTKLEKACEIIDEVFKKPGINKVMMASPWRETDLQMSKTFAEKGYMVFRLTSEMSKHKRAELVAQFRAWPSNAIICGTMGCLKSGLNLPEVNTVIAESYPWNFAQLHQYAARAVRLNSTEKTEIYCLTSEGSFDINVFSLILRKEVANTFVRTSKETSMAELSKDFGVESTDLFTQALQMVKEKTNGRTRGTIKWGSKAILENSNS